MAALKTRGKLFRLVRRAVFSGAGYRPLAVTPDRRGSENVLTTDGFESSSDLLKYEDQHVRVGRAEFPGGWMAHSMIFLGSTGATPLRDGGTPS